MIFRDQEQRKRFAIAFIALGEQAGEGDGRIIASFGRDLLGTDRRLTVLDLFTGTTSTTLRELILPALVALAHGHAGIDAWLLRNSGLVEQGLAWVAAVVAGQTGGPPMQIDSTRVGIGPVYTTKSPPPAPNGIPPQVVE